jgi:hypothetical protein
LARRARVATTFGSKADVALDALEVMELAWHDCYGEVSPSEEVIDDVLVLSEGSLERLIPNIKLAVTDPRDLKVAADARRRR